MKAWIQAARALVEGGSEAVRRLPRATEAQKAMLAKGAEEFAIAIASGDIVKLRVFRGRRSTCAGCESMVYETAPGADGPSHWCGAPLVDRIDERDRPTCGCLCIVKCVVASQKCPQRLWPEDQPGAR